MWLVPRARSPWWALVVCCGLTACGGGEGETLPEEDSGNADLVVESMLPEPGAPVARNQKVSIVFRNPVFTDTLTVEVDGTEVPLATLDERQFRFVPLSLHHADWQYEVRIRAGVEDVQGQILDRDVAWTFWTEPHAVEQLPAPPLSTAEIELIESGDGSTPLDLVTDYDDWTSALYDISPPIDPSSPQLSLLVERMLTSVAHHGGIGLAAPQVGINRRLFVAEVDGAARAFINPTLESVGDEWGDMLEGCLSVPERDANVRRPRSVAYSYMRPDGAIVDQEQLQDAGPFVIPARLWQHEFDHLNGILLLDREGRPQPL